MDLDRELVAVTASTHADLIEQARRHAPHRALLRAASRQTAGRGRLGRTWVDSAGGSLLFSLALPWPRPASESAAVTLACGLAAARCLHEHGVRVALKWPNDILLGEGKLAGMLAEIAEDPAGSKTLVVGMGLNLALDCAQRTAISQPAADLSQCLGREVVLAQRELWLARMAVSVLEGARQFAREGFGPLCAPFNEFFAFHGRPVSLHGSGARDITGIARGVDARGRLILDCDGCLVAQASGELSLRPAAAADLARPGRR